MEPVKCPHWSPATPIAKLLSWSSTIAEILAASLHEEAEGKCAWLSKQVSDLEGHVVVSFCSSSFCEMCLNKQKEKISLEDAHREYLKNSLRHQGRSAITQLLTLYRAWKNKNENLEKTYKERLATLQKITPASEATDPDSPFAKELLRLKFSVEEELQPAKFLGRVKVIGASHKSAFEKLSAWGYMEEIKADITKAVTDGKLPLDIAEAFVAEAFPEKDR